MNRYHRNRLYAGIVIVLALTAMLTVSVFVIGQQAAAGAENPPQPSATEKQTGRRIYLPDPDLPEEDTISPESAEKPADTEKEAEETDKVVIRRTGSETEDFPEETGENPNGEETLPAETDPQQPEETEIPETSAPETKAPETEPPAPETEPPTPETEPPVPETEPPTPVTEPPVPETEPPVPETEPPTPVTEPPVPETEPPTPETEPPAPETEPPVPETEPPVPETEPPVPETEPPVPETEPPLPPVSDDSVYGPYGNFRYNIRSICGNDNLTTEQHDFIAKSCREYGVELELAYALMATESGFGYWRTHVNSNGTVDWGILQLNDCNIGLLQEEFPISSMSDVIQNFEMSVRTGLYVIRFAEDNVRTAGYDTDAWRVILSYHYYIVDAEKKWNNYGWTCEQDAMNDTYCSIVLGWYHKFLDAKSAYEASLPAAG